MGPATELARRGHDVHVVTAVVVCHGGMGITQRALLNGVPPVVIPFGRDQLEVARRVEHAAAGVRLNPKKLDPTSLRRAVEQARGRAAGAVRVAESFREAGGDSRAADLVEGLLAGRGSDETASSSVSLG